MNYQLIISDYDGTLRRDDGSIGEYTLQAIKDFRAQGGIFAICSGRMTSSVMEIAKNLGLSGLAVSFQGSVITDMDTGETLYQKNFTREEAIYAISILEELGYHAHVYTTNRFYANYESEQLRYYESIVNGKAIIVPSLTKLLQENDFPIIKMLAMVKQEEKKAVYETICSKLDDRYYVTYSAAFLVEVTPTGADKGTAVKFLAEHYHIPIEKTIALGDNLNDYPMIAVAGMGVAVQNAAEELKVHADHVSVYSNEQDCVGHIIRKYGLGEEHEGF